VSFGDPKELILFYQFNNNKMKKSALTLVFSLYAVVLMAQVPAGFSYQAVVRNNSGETVAGKTVKFRFSILQNSATGTPVYVETQSKATNEFGLANLVVGSGTKVSGNFDPSAWGSNSHFLKVELDPNNGNTFSHLGTMQLMAVPYAFHAKTVEEVADNSVTSAKIADGTIVAADLASGSVNSAKIASNAVTEAKISAGAVTGAKMAQGGATSGQVLKWTGTTWAPAADNEGSSESVWQTSGDNVYRSAGKVGIGTSTPVAQLHVQGTSAGQGNILFAGAVKTSNPGNPPVSGEGTRLMWYPDKAALRAGYVGGTWWDKDNIGNYSVAFGYGPLASGANSVAMGVSPTASGAYSTAFGYMTIASGQTSTAFGNAAEASASWSVAMGNHTTASGANSIAMGKETTAEGENSVTIGRNVRALSFCETVIGSLNTGYTPQDKTGWNPNDRLFVIANGITTASNAITVLKSGRTGIGSDTPQAGLHVKGSGFPDSFIYLESGVGNDAGIRIYDGKTAKWHLFNNVAAGGLQIYNTDGNTAIFAKQSNAYVGLGNNSPTQQLDVNGNARIRSIGSGSYAGVVNQMKDGTLTTSTSDARLKTDVLTLQNGLETVMQLRGVSFTWINNPEYGKRIGFIAQEMEKVLPELVFTNEVDGYKGINYAEVSAVLVEAVKEQQSIIKELKVENDLLKVRLQKLENLMTDYADK
jgi:hypothetical protein